MVTDASPDTTVLAPDACLALLRTCQLGRLAVAPNGRVDVFPVNHVVDHGTVVLRTAPGTKLYAALDGPVAFEADGYDSATGEAWSVVLKGRVELVQRIEELVDAMGLPLHPWHGGPKPCFLRLVPDEVSGRRFAVTAPTGQTSPRTVAWE